LNGKTKIILINSPHNPTGKVFRQVELVKIAELLSKYPRVVVIEDNVYDGMVFDAEVGV
jgi:aspartate/methionine/tyrosine aminotransferase